MRRHIRHNPSSLAICHRVANLGNDKHRLQSPDNLLLPECLIEPGGPKKL